MKCRFCGDPLSEARAEIGKDYCMAKNCQAHHQREWNQQYTVVLVPKQGFTWVERDRVKETSGRSSGK